MNNDSASPIEETERYRTLLQQERRRVEHLSLINAVQRCVLSAPDLTAFLPLVAQVLAQHFTQCNVTIYLSDPLPLEEENAGEIENLKPAARAGEHPLETPFPESPEDNGALPLRSAREHHMMCRNFAEQLSPDCQPLPSSPTAILEIPLMQENRCLGVLELTSNNAAALDASDAVVLQMISTLLAGRIEACQVHDDMRELSAFQQSLFSTMLQSLLVIDDEGRVRAVNQRLCQILGATQSELENARLTDIFEPAGLQKAGVGKAIQDVTQNGVPHELESVRLTPAGYHGPDGALIFDVRIFRVFYRGKPQAVMLLIDLTARWRNFHQLQLMSEIGRFFSASLNIDTVLRTVLTCITAGNALGFNRAFLLLTDEPSGQLKGTMALGPASAAEAYQIWQELARREWDLQQILEAAENVSQTQNSSPLQEKICTVSIDPENPLLPALQTALNEQRALRVSHRELLTDTPPYDVSPEHRAQWENAATLFSAPEMVLAPLQVKGRLVGIVLADNAFSGNRIEESDVQLLNSLAGQAALTIDNARTYQALQKAQNEVVNAERLAVVGDMTARLSHEIRNPLSTIGGFARRLCKHPQDHLAVERYASVIVEEIDRLEELLGDLLEMANSSQLDLKPQRLHEIINKALLLADADIRSLGVQVQTDYDAQIPPLYLDRSRLLQALLNIIRNGAQSMPAGGILHVATQRLEAGGKPQVEIAISDQGSGMSQNAIKHVFDPFFSTKIKGSGLGLAITWRIVEDHGGTIRVDSAEGEGTTFTISLPLHEATNNETGVKFAANP